MKFILGQKLIMSQVFDEKGNQIPVTIVEAGPCQVLQIKTKEKDGYEAIQIGFREIKKKKIGKNKKQKPFKYLREFKGDVSKYKVGQKLEVSIFEEGDTVKVSGTSKGKGFQGGVKRWGFKGGRKTHGGKHYLRTIGSVSSTPVSRVIKGKKMPGRMGTERMTIKNLKITKIDSKESLLMIGGAVPGAKGTLLEIRTLK
ncbi:MAG: 50S ribosomal protein L3 [Patescibacteria group bacterium]|nr:50S ribosomal protein L3 [Patescibacteria group bacterium]